jgi:hypothetical protein
MDAEKAARDVSNEGLYSDCLDDLQRQRDYGAKLAANAIAKLREGGK